MKLLRQLPSFTGYLLLCFGLSPLSVSLFSSIGSNIIEPFVLAGALIVSKKESFHIPFGEVFKSKQNIITITTLILLGIIGLMTPIGISDNRLLFKYVYADLRTCYLLYFSFLLFRNKSWSSEQKVSFLKKFNWIIIAMGFLATYNKLHIDNTSSAERVLGIPVHFIVIQSFLYSRTNHYLLNIILLSLGGYYAIFSYARINIFFFAIQVLLFSFPLLTSSTRNKFGTVTRKILLVGTVAILSFAIPKAYDFYVSSETGKTQVDRIENGKEGERVSSLIVPFTDMDFYLTPEGLGWRNHIYKLGVHYNFKIISTQDSCFLYTFYHFGFFAGLFFNAYILFSILKNFIRKAKHPDLETLQIGFVALAFLMGFFTQGIYFTMPQFAAAGGIMFYIITNYNHTNGVKNQHNIC